LGSRVTETITGSGVRSDWGRGAREVIEKAVCGEVKEGGFKERLIGENGDFRSGRRSRPEAHPYHNRYCQGRS
jgi:hypothetical protein